MEIVTDGPTLVLIGDFDVRSTGEVRNAIYDHLECHDEDVVVDLTDVYAVDLTALKVLAVATRQASRAGHHLTLRGCGPSVRRMLHISRLIRVVEVERQAASA
jgi:anti-anti-sigma factor